MKRIWLLAGLTGLLLLVGCGDGGQKTPVPPPALTPSVTATTVELIDLATRPDQYDGQRLELTGRYGLLPVPPCNGVVHLSPATWALIGGGVVVQAGGLEQVLRPLGLDDMTLTIAGRWQKWVGPLGCGTAAVVSSVWYLQADRIVSPNPLIRATFTPPGLAAVPTGGTPEPLASPTLTVQPGTASPGPADSGRTPGPFGSPSPSWTPSRPATSSPTPSSTPSPTSLFSPLATPTPAEPSTPAGPLATLPPPPTVTPTASPTASPTTSPGASPSPTASPSATPTGGITFKGDVELDQVVNGKLAVDGMDAWVFSATAGDLITITVAPAAGLDLILTVRDPGGSDIAKSDASLIDEPETIAGLQLAQAGDYQFLVSEVDGQTGDYALVAMDDLSIPITFPGNLTYGVALVITLPADAFHIWHFQGTAGETITIRLSPNNSSDLLFGLYGPDDMDTAIEFVDNTAGGQDEELTIALAQSGFHSIWVEEWLGYQVEYEILLTRE